MEGNSTPMYMPVTPANYGGGFGDFGGNGWWILLLFLFAGGGMWGNGFGGFGGNEIYPWMNQADITTSGFQNQMLNTGISGIQNAVTSGFGDMQTALCGGFGTVNANIANGFAQAEIGANARQMADMNRSFDAQVATMQGFNGVQGQLSQCCCDNRLATVQTQNVVQSEGAATRNAILSGINAIKDQLCSDKLDAKNEKIVELNNRINFLEENNYVQNALTAQTQFLLNRLTTTTPTAPAA